MLTIVFSLSATLIHLAGAYLRFLPFKRDLDQQEIHQLWKYLLLWSSPGFLINLGFLAFHDVQMNSFKMLFALGWVPYVLIALWRIPHRPVQHLFVCGVQALWAFMLHAFSGMILALLYGSVTTGLLHLHLFCYLSLFILLLPLEQRLFGNLLPDGQFLSDSPLRWYIAILPVAIMISASILNYDVTFLPTWGGRATRLTLPLFFFLFYSVVGISTRESAKQMELLHTNQIIKKQLSILKWQTHLMQQNASLISVLRHDLRHSYRLIYSLIEEKDDTNILSYIQTQQKLLEDSSMTGPSPMALIDSILAFFEHQAIERGCRFRYETALSRQTPVIEREISLLISNLLEENVGNSAPKDKIQLTLSEDHPLFTLQIHSSRDILANLGESNLSSLNAFKDKFYAQVKSTSDGNEYYLTITWQMPVIS